MSGKAVPAARKSWIWDVLIASGLLAALPNLLAMFFFGAWISVPDHYARDDGEPMPVYGLSDILLHYTPFFLVLLLAVGAIVVRWKGRQKWAAGLAALQIFALATVSAQFFPIP